MKKSAVDVWWRTALSLVAAIFLLASCSESSGDETNEYVDWQQRNETYFNSVYQQAQSEIANGNSQWKVLTKYSIEESVATTTDHIVVKVLSEGTGTDSPLYTAACYVHYKGTLIPTQQHLNGLVFDKSINGSEIDITTDKPSLFKVSALTDGFATALQYMHIGDHWRVYVPYQLGYGTSGSGSIPGFSTLIFDIYLCAFDNDGDIPEWR